MIEDALMVTDTDDTTQEKPSRARRRNLGIAIFLVAIQDYRRMDEQLHQDAEQFLFPVEKDWQEHYGWAMSMADGVNPAWLRDALDRSRGKWDAQRLVRKALLTRKTRLERRTA